MDKVLELFQNFKAFIIREFLWFFLSIFIAMMLTIISLWLLNEFSISLINRLEWQQMDANSIYLIIMISWFTVIYLIRLVHGAILYLTIPTPEVAEEE